MKRNSTIISEADLYNEIDNLHLFWSDVVGEDEAGEIPRDGAYWVVSWGESVLSPKFNSDGSYDGPYAWEQIKSDYPEAKKEEYCVGIIEID